MKLQFEHLKHMTPCNDPGTILNDLMKAYSKDVWNYAFILTKNKETSDDLMQEVFLNAYRRIHTFRGESSVKTWLLKMTRNASLNYLKSAFFRKVILVEKIFPKGQTRSAEQEMMSRIQTKAIWELVLRLPVKYREVILLEAHYEYTEHEMAELLGVSRGTVKSRLHRARAKVERALKEADAE